MLHWWKFIKRLSAYHDHSLSPVQYRSLWRHLFHCEECRDELNEFEQMGSALRRISAAPLPPNLVSQICARLSEERLRREQPGLWWKLKIRWSNVAVPCLSGLVAAVMLFGILVPGLWPSGTSRNDTPLLLHTPARLLDTGTMEMGTGSDDLVVQILVDAQGRVADYDIVSGTYTDKDVHDLRNRLLFTRFDPATVFGTPQSETLLLSFHNVHVRG